MKSKEKKSKDSVPTKERILNGALKLFNEKGESRITTAQIAEDLKVVELRFFSGLDVVETAEVLGVSESTIKRDRAMARAWLHLS